MSNVYYNPSDFGLEIVTEFELSEPCYSFDTVVVWANEKGEYFIDQDSGCSCPSPFEDSTLETLTGPLDFFGAVKEMTALASDSYDKEYAREQLAGSIEVLALRRNK